MANQKELERIADEKHEPKLSRILKYAGTVIAVLILSNLWAYLGIKERIEKEAATIVDKRLIDPQLTNTLHEALNKKAVPFITAQVHPIEMNVGLLKTNLEKQKLVFETIARDISNKQEQLSSEQIAIRKQLHPLSDQIVSLQMSIDVAHVQATRLTEEQKLMGVLNRAELFDKAAIEELQTIARGTNETAPLARAAFSKVRRTLILDRGSSTWLTTKEEINAEKFSGPFTSDERATFLADASSLDGTINIIGEKEVLFVPKLVELAHTSKDLWIVNRIANSL